MPNVFTVNWTLSRVILPFLLLRSIRAQLGNSDWGYARLDGFGGFPNPGAVIGQIFPTSSSQRYILVINFHQDAAGSSVLLDCKTRPFLQNPTNPVTVLDSVSLAYLDGVVIQGSYFDEHIVCNATLGSTVKMFPINVLLEWVYSPIKTFHLLRDLTALGVGWEN